MMTKIPLMFAVLAGMAIGVLGMKASGAQEALVQQRPAFYISEFEITDPEGMKPYSARVESTFKQFGGRYIARGGKVASLEGEPVKGGIVIIAFDSMEKAQAWYDSPAYQELKPIRRKAAKSRVFTVEGAAS